MRGNPVQKGEIMRTRLPYVTLLGALIAILTVSCTGTEGSGQDPETTQSVRKEVEQEQAADAAPASEPPTSTAHHGCLDAGPATPTPRFQIHRDKCPEEKHQRPDYDALMARKRAVKHSPAGLVFDLPQPPPQELLDRQQAFAKALQAKQDALTAMSADDRDRAYSQFKNEFFADAGGAK
jgi:hypothetical protein